MKKKPFAKIVTVIGARPQFIKAAAVSRAIHASDKRRSGSTLSIQEVLVHTGQHYDRLMNEVFFEELDNPKPDYFLGVGSGSHGLQTGAMLEQIEAVLEKERPGGVMVYGDTNTTLAGALAAAKMNIPVIHVEAGLRSYNRRMPEEINRVLTDHVSEVLFCPTRQAVKNLSDEGIRPGQEKIVENVGDVMYDSVLHYSKLADVKSPILKELNFFQPGDSCVADYYLATLHRAENTDNPKRLKSILAALGEIGKNTPVVVPLHPRTKKMISTYRLLPKSRGLKLIDPVSYLSMLNLEKNAKAVLTDSGGVQKEAFWFKVPCLTLREETEWVETVQSGWNVVAGAEKNRILHEIGRLKKKKEASRKTGPFGDGKAGEKIVRTLAHYFN